MRWTEAGLALVLAAAAGVAGQTAGPAAPEVPRAPGVLPGARRATAGQRFVVVLDAAHGGDDDGARLGKGILEKSLTLELAGHLEALLRRQGIAVTTVRTGDVDLSALNRAEAANHAQAAACLVIHATATGSGVHLFTSSLAPGSGSADATPAGAGEAPLLPWGTAQGEYVTDSLKLESELEAALVHAEIPVTMGRASVPPMDSLACPAVAVELAPLAPGNTTKGRPITDEEYQRRVEGALAAAIGSWRIDRMEH